MKPQEGKHETLTIWNTYSLGTNRAIAEQWVFPLGWCRCVVPNRLITQGGTTNEAER